MKINLNYRNILNYLLIYFLIISQGSILYKQYQDLFYIATVLVFVVVYIIKEKGKLKDRTYFLWVSAILFSMLMSFFVTGGSLGIPSIVNAISRFLFVYIIYDYDRKNFCTYYIKIVAFLAEISLFLFLIQTINPEVLKTILPQHVVGSQTYYGAIIYTMAVGHTTRNVGVFAEPGLYQIVLSTGLFMLLFMDEKINVNDTKKKWYIILLLITLITAQSTTGYISAIILIATFLFSRQTKKHSTIKRVLIVAIGMFLVWDFSKGTEGLIYSTILEKMFDVNTGALNLSQNTGSARLYSGIADLRITMKYPFGAGFDVYNRIWKSNLPVLINDDSSCMGITKSMATFGIPTTVLILFFYFYLMRKNGYSLMMKISYTMLFINISLGQPSIIYAALMILLLVENKDENLNLCRKQISEI